MALGDNHLESERALRVFIKAATPPGATMQQHALGVETVGGDGEPPKSDLAVTGAVQAEQQQEPSPPVTSAEPFPLLLDEPDVVDGYVVSGIAVRCEPVFFLIIGGSGALGFGTQQSELLAVAAVAASNGPGAVQGMATSSGTGSVRRSVLQKRGGLGQHGASAHPFDSGTPKYNISPLRPETEPGTVWGGA